MYYQFLVDLIQGAFFAEKKEAQKCLDIGGVSRYAVFRQAPLGYEVLEIQLKCCCKLFRKF